MSTELPGEIKKTKKKKKKKKKKKTPNKSNSLSKMTKIQNLIRQDFIPSCKVSNDFELFGLSIYLRTLLKIFCFAEITVKPLNIPNSS